MTYEELKKSLFKNQMRAVEDTIKALGFSPAKCLYRLSERVGVPYKYLDAIWRDKIIRLRVTSEAECIYDGVYALCDTFEVPASIVNTTSLCKGENRAVH